MWRGALARSLSHTHRQTDTDTGAAATQCESRRRRKMLSVLRSPFYVHFKICAVYFVFSFLLNLALGKFLPIFFALFLFVFNQNALLLLLLLPAVAGLANTFLMSVSLCLWWEDIDSTHTHKHGTHDRKVEEEAAVTAAARSAANRCFADFQATQKQQQTWEQQHQWSTPRSRLHFCCAR